MSWGKGVPWEVRLLLIHVNFCKTWRVDYVKAGKAGAFGLGVSFLGSGWMSSALWPLIILSNPFSLLVSQSVIPFFIYFSPTCLPYFLLASMSSSPHPRLLWLIPSLLTYFFSSKETRITPWSVCFVFIFFPLYFICFGFSGSMFFACNGLIS